MKIVKKTPDHQPQVLLDNLFPDLLAIAFIVLKLTGQIDWNWLFVVSPILLPFVCSFLYSFIRAFRGR